LEKFRWPHLILDLAFNPFVRDRYSASPRI
jgi:hypothetical protein